MQIDSHRLKGIELYRCDYRDLKVSDESAALVIADPIWNEPEQFQTLGPFAEKVLRPGGTLLLFSGTCGLPTKLATISPHLSFQTVLVIVYSYSKNRLIERLKTEIPLTQAVTRPKKRYAGGGRFFESSTLVTLWSKGDACLPLQGSYLSSVYVDEGFEKEFSDFQQSLGAIRYFVENMTKPNDLVIEPFGGGFTVAQACRLTGRRCIACDIRPGCVEIGLRRLQQTDR